MLQDAVSRRSASRCSASDNLSRDVVLRGDLQALSSGLWWWLGGGEVDVYDVFHYYVKCMPTQLVPHVVVDCSGSFLAESGESEAELPC